MKVTLWGGPKDGLEFEIDELGPRISVAVPPTSMDMRPAGAELNATEWYDVAYYELDIRGASWLRPMQQARYRFTGMRP